MASELIAWDRLVRYVSASDGTVKYGQPILDSPDVDVAALAEEGKLEVLVAEGENPLAALPGSQKDQVKSLLGPFRVEDVPIIRCIGLNYKTHIKETGRPLPTCPTVFTKPAPAITDHDSPIPIPKIAQEQCDYEGELTILIGKDAYDVSPEDALNYVAAYTVGNDISARDVQFKDIQITLGKNLDGFAPIGPCILTADALPNPEAVRLTTRLNGETMQDSSTANQIFGVAEVISFVTQAITLEPGDLIITGTPAGVGAFRKPPVWLQPGDEITIEIDGVGRVTNPVTTA